MSSLQILHPKHHSLQLSRNRIDVAELFIDGDGVQTGLVFYPLQGAGEARQLNLEVLNRLWCCANCLVNLVKLLQKDDSLFDQLDCSSKGGDRFLIYGYVP